MKKLAFTLAEVLITLTVIGVVAAMVLPNLLGHYEKKTLETQTKHFYSMMTLALHNYMADNKVDDLMDSPMFCERFEEDEDGCERANKELKSFIMKYLKVALVCGESDYPSNTSNTCYSVTTKVLDKNSDAHGIWGPNYILAHGYAMRMRTPDVGWPAVIQVDVNGEAGPNRGGRDLWEMSVFYDGSIHGASISPECQQNQNNCTLYGNTRATKQEIIDSRFEHCKEFGYDGGGCFGHFKENGFKFDY